ncbi:hypothetical protein ENSA5_67360 [Enhygromyxa salina]|uniref:Uncharacterized protein n=1 Tax=Enhygromyxa salina TaxID=215803 RepID=A0A2S9XB87_9BACT|nr:hypothetical protein [Enhygromyxa salina]PRP90118.1 hypothetical protein ENSA5_67360 [Enhygromyxa salina]
MLEHPSSCPPLWLGLASVALTAWSIARAWPKWRFERLALRGFDSPGAAAGPFRQGAPEATPNLRPMYGFERDPGSLIFFTLHFLACVGGILALSTVLWFAVAVVEGMPLAANTVSALAALFAAVLAVPMWLGQRLLHGLLGGLLALFVFALWPPAVPLLLVIVVVQHDLIRRRSVADEREQGRREAHERERTTGA